MERIATPPAHVVQIATTQATQVAQYLVLAPYFPPGVAVKSRHHCSLQPVIAR